MMQFLTSTLRLFDSFSFAGVVNVLQFARKVFDATASNQKLQREVVQTLLGSTNESGLARRSASTRSPKVWEASADLFRHLLNSRVSLGSVWLRQLKYNQPGSHNAPVLSGLPWAALYYNSHKAYGLTLGMC